MFILLTTDGKCGIMYMYYFVREKVSFVTKFSKFVALCAALFLMICCMAFTGCHKAKPQNDATEAATTKKQVGGTNTTLRADLDNQDMSDDDDLILEIETHGTEKQSRSTVRNTTNSSTVGNTTNSSTTSRHSASSNSNTSVSSKKSTQYSNTVAETTVTTTRTTQAGWTPDLGKKPR